MKYRLLDLMSCPECNKPFAISVFSKKEREYSKEDNKNRLKKCETYCAFSHCKLEMNQSENIDCNSCQKIEIEEGILICNACKKWFPIIGFIPRIIPKTIEEHPDFFKKYKERLPEELINKNQLEAFLKLKKKTMSSFGFQWTHYKDIIKDVERFVFLRKTGIEPSFLKGKLVLDVGCGYGRYSYAALEFGGKEVIGIDLSRAVESAYENTINYPNVHIIQADIFHLPFREQIFDVIFSLGVLHHTPSTKEAFMKLIPFLKKMGTIIIWVYRRRQPIRMVLNHIIRLITLKIPHPILWRLSWIAKPLGGLVLMLSGTKYIPTVYKGQKVSMEVSKFPKIYRILARLFFFVSVKPNGNERWGDTFDWWSPHYEHFHTQEEVIGWFKEVGLQDITITSRQDVKDDIGVKGIKK